MTEQPFWETKSLAEMIARRVGEPLRRLRPLLPGPLRGRDTGEIIPTRVHCKLFDPDACRCTDYEDRKRHVPDCIKLTPGNIDDLGWMPKSCAYRRL